jgi:hypothetical protein
MSGHDAEYTKTTIINNFSQYKLFINLNLLMFTK